MSRDLVYINVLPVKVSLLEKSEFFFFVDLMNSIEYCMKARLRAAGPILFLSATTNIKCVFRILVFSN